MFAIRSLVVALALLTCSSPALADKPWCEHMALAARRAIEGPWKASLPKVLLHLIEPSGSMISFSVDEAGCTRGNQAAFQMTLNWKGDFIGLAHQSQIFITLTDEHLEATVLAVGAKKQSKAHDDAVAALFSLIAPSLDAIIPSNVLRPSKTPPR